MGSQFWFIPIPILNPVQYSVFLLWDARAKWMTLCFFIERKCEIHHAWKIGIYPLHTISIAYNIYAAIQWKMDMSCIVDLFHGIAKSSWTNYLKFVWHSEFFRKNRDCSQEMTKSRSSLDFSSRVHGLFTVKTPHEQDLRSESLTQGNMVQL